MILRSATADDAAALETFPLGGQPSVWLDEVAELVSGLIGWQRDLEHADFDRQVVVADVDGEIVAVCAHEREQQDGGPSESHRYVMVLAVRSDQRRAGVATLLMESVLSDMQRRGVATAGWLVHPRNLDSIQFSRTGFGGAEETYPYEDRPYVRFTLRL